MMSVLKKESRNAFGNERDEEESGKDYENIFRVCFPRTDTADKIMRKPEERESEKLKTGLPENLSEKRIFHKYRLPGKYHRITADGTHVMTVEEGHCGNCPHTQGKTVCRTYTRMCVIHDCR